MNNKEGILPIVSEYQVYEEKKRDEKALARVKRLMMEMIIEDPKKAEKFFGVDKEDATDD